ncbi:EF-hand domain-containing family member C2-like isoform X2 [Lethenteron reissneri]|uniref:EF-hand domain-containing family member C2-like isoform X2 n=1 Tax=Lethenteron reissneri TaxID=7753 RepID=UPI002AB644D0|nr:EF-hand domain-containing family member C2-like isoform X2 [Lethenteron reissneri]
MPRTAPAWLAYSNQVLSFEGFTREEVPQSPVETRRVRHVRVLFFLEDDSIQVVEPQVKNAGMPQGTIIRRQRIPLPGPRSERCYTAEDLNVGHEVVFFSRVFTLASCDAFTRHFLRRLGVRPGTDAPLPADPYTSGRDALEGSQRPRRPYERVDTLRQFLERDRQVLRFYCAWHDDEDDEEGDLVDEGVAGGVKAGVDEGVDDGVDGGVKEGVNEGVKGRRRRRGGEPRRLVLHYFLADDTVELRETLPPNSGRDAAPVFLRRGRLPKLAPQPLRLPGASGERTVLNVIAPGGPGGPGGHGGRFILDSLKTGAPSEEFYSDGDLRVGVTVNAWGRPLHLLACDGFTRQYLSDTYGTESVGAVASPPGSPPRTPPPQMPPYNGFGSEEDTRRGCLALVPKPPQKDFVKFMELGRQGLDGHVLRFTAEMKSGNPVDEGRRFVVSYFLEDDTISVFEQEQRNSGVVAGRFLERGAVEKPGQPRFCAAAPARFLAPDLHVGAVVALHGRTLHLTGADRYTLRYMETHRDQFPEADASLALAVLRAALGEGEGPRAFRAACAEADALGTGALPWPQFRALVRRACGPQSLSDHGLITLARKFHVHRGDDDDDEEKERGDVEEEEEEGATTARRMMRMRRRREDEVGAACRKVLRARRFEEFPVLLQEFAQRDAARSGWLCVREARSVCKSLRLPVDDSLLHDLLDTFSQGAEQAGVDYNRMVDYDRMVDYERMVEAIKWRENATVDMAHPRQVSAGEEGGEAGDEVSMVPAGVVSYAHLLQELFGAAE